RCGVTLVSVVRGGGRRPGGDAMAQRALDVERYKARLLDLEGTLSARIDRSLTGEDRPAADGVRDTGDASLADVGPDAEAAEAERDSTLLRQVRDALGRIADGTFGRCVVDGGPIEEKRLEAMPWTPYCLRHEREKESATVRRPATL